MFVLKNTQRIGNMMRIVKNIKFNPSTFISKQLFSIVSSDSLSKELIENKTDEKTDGKASNPPFKVLIERAKKKKIDDDNNYNKIWNEKQTKQKKLNDLEQELSNLEIEIVQLKQKIQESEIEIVQFKQKLEFEVPDLKQKSNIEITELKEKSEFEISKLKQESQVEIANLKQEIINNQNKIKDYENKFQQTLSKDDSDFYKDMLKIHYTEVKSLRDDLKRKEDDLKDKVNDIKDDLKRKEDDFKKKENDLRKKENDLEKKVNDLKNDLKEKENYFRDKEKDLKDQQTKLENEINNLSNLLSRDVRSLFKDHKNIIPKTIDNQLKIGDDDINLNFVNRKNELIQAWRCCAENAPNRDIKHYLLVSGQMFGSGKTVFGKQLFNFKNPYIKSIFKNDFKPKGSQNKTILRNTLPVFIDLKSLKDKFDSINDKFDSMYDLISCCVFVSTLNQYFQIDIGKAKEFWKRNKIPPSDCTSLLLSLVGKTLFFHFDEIGRLPELLLNFEKHKDPYYKFWDSIDTVQKEGCFVYASGRSTVLNFFGFHDGLQGSPSRVSHIRLSLFQVEDIQDILWYSSTSKKQNKVTEVGKKLKIKTKEEAEKISKWLHNFSTGVPRIVEYSLTWMINQTIENQSKSLIDWENKTTLILTDDNLTPLLPSFPEDNDEKRNKEIAVLVCYSMINFKIDKSAKLDDSYIIDLVPYYGFYLEKVEKTDKFIVKYPQLWIKHGVFDKIPSVSKLYQPPIDKSKALEELSRNKILFITNYSKISSSSTFSVSEGFEFLSNTSMANEYLPKLEYKIMETRLSTSKRKGGFHKYIKTLESQNVLIEPAPQSSLPDLITIFGSSTDNKCYVGFQMKNYPTSTLQTSQLPKELSKFTDILPKGKYKAAVFVMVVNGEVDEIMKKYQGIVISNSDTAAMNELQIKLPNNKVQFIILSDDQMNQFFDEKRLTELSSPKKKDQKQQQNENKSEELKETTNEKNEESK